MIPATGDTSPMANEAEAVSVSLRDWHHRLAGLEPEEQRERLIAALLAVREAQLPLEEKLEAVRTADQAWQPMSANLSKRYRRDVTAVRMEAARFHAQMGAVAQIFADLYARLAGTLLAYAAAEVQLREMLPQVTACALFHLAKSAKWQICGRMQADARVWHRLHELFRLAVQEGFDTRPIDLFQTGEKPASCSQLWLRAVMLGTLNMGNLSPRQVDRAEGWLLDWSAGIGIDSGYQESKHLYCVDLAGDAGPVRITQGLKMMHPVFLWTTGLYADIVAARLHYFDPAMMSSHGFYARNPLLEYVDLLDQLQRMWTSVSFHVQGRLSARKVAPSGTLVEVVRGVAAILALRESGNGRTVAPAWWTVREHSERGVGLVGPSDRADMPLTQQLIALRWQDAVTWQLGVIVRVMNLQDQNARHVGVRLLAREAIVLSLTRIPGAAPGAETAAPASVGGFFLAGNERSGQADSLLCPAGAVVTKMQLLVKTGGGEFVIWINRVIEGTGDWQRVGFKVLEKRAVSAQTDSGIYPATLISSLPGAVPQHQGGEGLAGSATQEASDAYQTLSLQLDEELKAMAKPPEKKELGVADYLALINAQHPRLATAIELMWGEIECEKYLDKLILSDRETRQGFAEPVMSALLALNKRHAKEFKFRAD